LAVALLIIVDVLLKPNPTLAETGRREGFKLRAVDVVDTRVIFAISS